MSTFSLDRLLSFGSSGEREAEQARKGQKTAEELERLSVPEAGNDPNPCPDSRSRSISRPLSGVLAARVRGRHPFGRW